MFVEEMRALSQAECISESPKEALATAARLVQVYLVLMVTRDGKQNYSIRRAGLAANDHLSDD